MSNVCKQIVNNLLGKPASGSSALAFISMGVKMTSRYKWS